MADKSRIKIIACPTVGEELKQLLPDNFEMALLDYGLHNVPEKLHAQLQTEIDVTSSDVGTILFGYGLCANAIIGLKSHTFKLVFPRADDCITLFLGSRDEYLRQFRQAPGTFYLTRGWIECGEDPYTEYCAMREKIGHERALRITKQYIANYTRLALIKSENHDRNLEAYRKYAKMVADHFDLVYEEIPGSNSFLKKLLHMEWDHDFVIIEPGNQVRYDSFFKL
ncbi:MAG: DUF1638 domain-containing protein [Anaerolineales bacterium]|nr:DUF1638 domain-containing protein [Anaerolineales bacterium]